MLKKNEAAFITLLVISLLGTFLKPHEEVFFYAEKYIFSIFFILTPLILLTRTKIALSKSHWLIIAILLLDIAFKLLPLSLRDFPTKSLALAMIDTPLILWVFLFASENDKMARMKYWKALLITAILLALFSIPEYFAYDFAVQYVPFIFEENPYLLAWKQTSSFSGNPNIFGIFMAISFIIANYLFYNKKISLKFFFTTTLLFFFGIYASGSRMALLVFISSFMFLGYLKFLNKKIIKWAPFLLYLSVTLFSLLVGYKKFLPNLNMRQKLWIHAQQMWSENIFTGVGPYIYQSLLKNYSSMDNIKYGSFSTHSFFWGIIVDSGFLGLIFIWGGLGLIFLTLPFKKKEVNKFMIILCFSMFLSQLTENHILFIPTMAMVFYFCLVELVSPSTQEPLSTAPPKRFDLI